ncbi:MAG: hypothetical protein AB1758_23670, partial [Candidatus Eremiobacterota bacterium]
MPIPALLVEDHCQALDFWRECGVRGAACVHVDAHLDVTETGTERGSVYIPGGLNCGNFLYLALAEGLVEHLVWVIPPALAGTLAWARRELQEWVDLTGAEYASLCLRDGRVEGRLLGRRLTICRLDVGLPELAPPVLLDVDVDYLVAEEQHLWQ